MLFVEKFAESGWLQMGGLFQAELIDRLREEVESQLDELLRNEGGRRGYLRVGDERVMLSVKLRGPMLDPMVYGNPLLLTVLRQLLAADILIDSFTCVLAMPGAREQHLHRDHPQIFPERPELQASLSPYAVTVVVPLVDLTPDTGTTRLYPGTHHGEDKEGEEHPYVKRGDCFLLDYRLQHQGTANNSGTTRPVLYVTYARPWFTDMSNFRRQPRINIAREDVERIPPDHWPLFRRIAGKGSIDLSEEELFREQ